jgi:tryptophan-rich sensory protein
MGFYYKLFIFLLINFGGLWLGSLLQGGGARSEWYQGLEIAPWTPPGWAFGVAWVSIMFCFSFFMAYATDLKVFDYILFLFIIQFVLNVGWNAVFFRYHYTGFALSMIIMLTVLMMYFFFYSLKSMEWKVTLLLPYILWMIVATSLNWYAWAKN